MKLLTINVHSWLEENQEEKMEWTAEKQKFDEQIAREIVQEKRFDILRKNFPTATEMTLYSNEVYPYPYRRNSVLALLTRPKHKNSPTTNASPVLE